MNVNEYQLKAHGFADYTILNISVEEVMQKNIDKLTSRKERGVIKGEGDNR